MLLDPEGWRPANRINDVLAELPETLRGRATAETHACAIELASRPHAAVDDAIDDLAALRRMLDGALGRLGLCAAVSGTHPSALWTEAAISSHVRYRRIHASMRELARREPTFALHVHVAVPDGEAAVRALDGLRSDLPLLLALSANSPYWQGRDSGLASARTPVFSMFPRVGIPRRFSAYRAYVNAVDLLVSAGCVPDPTFLWWDARLQPRLGTLEVRIMDAQTRLADTAALAALVQSLVCLYAGGRRRREDATPEALDENRFLAARDGIAARLLDTARGHRRAARDRVSELLDDCRPVARALGSIGALESVAALADDPPHMRQRTLAKPGLQALTAELGAQFAPSAAGVAA